MTIRAFYVGFEMASKSGPDAAARASKRAAGLGFLLLGDTFFERERFFEEREARYFAARSLCHDA